MTMSAGADYQAPKGFYSNFTVDKTGQLYSGGKALNGIMMDAQNATMGGSIMGLSTDAKGNVYADVSRRKQPTGSGFSWMDGVTPTSSTAPAMATGNNGSNPTDLTAAYSPFQTFKVKLSGVQLDPDRYSKSGDGELGNNQLYLRPDQSGAYFAQVNRGGQVLAYAYSAFNQAKNAVGGPDAADTNNQRRQGGNAGGGTSPTSAMVSLLGD